MITNGSMFPDSPLTPPPNPHLTHTHLLDRFMVMHADLIQMVSDLQLHVQNFIMLKILPIICCLIPVGVKYYASITKIQLHKIKKINIMKIIYFRSENFVQNYSTFNCLLF